VVSGFGCGFCAVRSWDRSRADSMGWSVESFRQSFRELFVAGLAKADWEAGLVWVPNAVTYNEPQNPNVVKSWADAWAELPECQLKSQAFTELCVYLDGRGKSFAEVFRNDCLNYFDNHCPNQEQDQEQEQEQEQEGRVPPPSIGCVCSGGTCLSPTICDSGKVEAIAKASVADLTKPREKTRPRTANDVEHCLRVAIQREQPENGIWNPGGSFAAKEAREFLEGFGAELEAALPTIEARIELFAKDKTMSPWTIAKFAKAYNGIGQAKPEARQPYPAQRQAVYPKLPRAAS
jgi:hypothetical protein